jgi:putative transcriptional regulator
MSRTKGTTKVGQSILRGALEALAFARGEKNYGCVAHVPEEIDVKAIRRRSNRSQSEFSRSYGFSKRSLEQWEQGTRVPTGAARVFLTVIASDPEAVLRALSGSTSGGGRGDQKRKAVSNHQSAGTEV